MADTKKVIRMLNNTLRHCHNLYNHVTSEEQTWLAEINQGAKEALELLKAQEEEQTTDAATWIQHLFRFGSIRFECSHCHGTSWKPSDYCPDCGAKTDEKVVNIDD